MSPTKPPYRIPTMKEIRELREPNGLNVVSTFSGCGGGCVGFEWAGFDVRWASEFIPIARETYELNHPGVPVDSRDIREVEPKDILEVAGLKLGEVDVLEGSPPCTAFSMAGRREKNWGKAQKYFEREQVVEDLFFEFIRLVKGIHPRAFVAENVEGLVKGKARGWFLDFRDAFRALGYNTEAKVLDAQWLGVPQRRPRVIIVGIRGDLGREPAFPTPLPYRYSFREAVEGLEDVDGPGIGSYAIGREWDEIRPGKASSRYFNLVKPDLDLPAPTVTRTSGVLGAASIVHPLHRRKLSVAELKRICGFPDDFELLGDYQQQVERLGCAVPPPMMRAVAESLAREVFDVKPGRPTRASAEQLV